MFKKMIRKWKFEFASFKLKWAYKKTVKIRLEVLEWCLCKIDKIGIPINETDNEKLKQLFSLYDAAIKDMNNDVDRYRSYVCE